MAGQVSATVGDAHLSSLWRLGQGRDGGDRRAAHFRAAHAMQPVPLAFPVLLALRGKGAPMLILYTPFIAQTFWQALQSQPFVPVVG